MKISRTKFVNIILFLFVLSFWAYDAGVVLRSFETHDILEEYRVEYRVAFDPGYTNGNPWLSKLEGLSLCKDRAVNVASLRPIPLGFVVQAYSKKINDVDGFDDFEKCLVEQSAILNKKFFHYHINRESTEILEQLSLMIYNLKGSDLREELKGITEVLKGKVEDAVDGMNFNITEPVVMKTTEFTMQVPLVNSTMLNAWIIKKLLVSLIVMIIFISINAKALSRYM